MTTDRRPPLMSVRWLNALPSLLVIALAGFGAWWLLRYPATPAEQPLAIKLPAVRVQTVAPQSVSVTVHSQGVIIPRLEIDLVPQVAGAVISAHPALALNGFFKKGEVLVQLDPRDYDTALIEAEAQVAEARKVWQRETAEAEQAKIDWQALGQGQPSPYVLHQPQRDAAKAQLAAAEARLRQARLNRERTAIRAPFDGRVRESRGVGVGQYLGAGNEIARLYPTDRVRVRLPLKDRDLAYVDLPHRPANTNARQLHITLQTEFAGRRISWPARIAAIDGVIDEKTRLIHALAEVIDPFSTPADPERPPLAIGSYVTAEIPGRAFENVVVLPLGALHGDTEVLVVEAEQHLRIRKVEVLRQERDRVLVRTGLVAGERVVISPIEEAVDGMSVRVEAYP